jgi:hypothetical protein
MPGESHAGRRFPAGKVMGTTKNKQTISREKPANRYPANSRAWTDSLNQQAGKTEDIMFSSNVHGALNLV